ncbi:hypothetical protein TrLO_g12573 [Triparma laevis f. longispina]|uniref:Uncharacterized protein n=1 Tax=Triparma laevis f. longispina TaxID=1714387 RepID=A0A9W7E170_9STRA|nr:hypothetical protein TrLO_g12573 [Triparma laevis f. longispina]
MATTDPQVEQYFVGGVQEVTTEKLKELKNQFGPIHLIFGILPCQDFTGACIQNYHKTVDERFEMDNDKKFVEFGGVVEEVRKLNSRVIILNENVMTTAKGVNERMNDELDINGVRFNVKTIYKGVNRPRLAQINVSLLPSRLHPLGEMPALLPGKNNLEIQFNTLRASHKNGLPG